MAVHLKFADLWDLADNIARHNMTPAPHGYTWHEKTPLNDFRGARMLHIDASSYITPVGMHSPGSVIVFCTQSVAPLGGASVI
jgi:hypothetical protein